ncbi:MAG: hypothetical protein H8E32_13250 [Nitrospinae bacterium]|nr:hypothetical protein [Nitrospinota bacterium]
MRIAIFLIFISIQAAGIISGTKVAIGNDLQISFESEVAGITPEMTILPLKKGNLDQPNSKIAKAWDSNSNHANRNSVSISESREKLPVDLYASAGFISNKMTPVGKVSKVFDNKLATTGPERIFIDIGRQQGLEVGDKFTVYSEGRLIYHPVIGHKNEFRFTQPRRTGFAAKKIWSSSGKPMGNTIVIRGVLEVAEVGDTTSYARIIKAYKDIKPGELLIPYQEMIEPPSAYKNDKFIEGYIVATKGDRIGVGITDIVYIDKGWEDGVRSGDVFEVYHIPEIVEKPWYQVKSFGLKKTPLLPDVLGEIKVVSTQKHTATATIVQNNYDMHAGQKIRTKH